MHFKVYRRISSGQDVAAVPLGMVSSSSHAPQDLTNAKRGLPDSDICRLPVQTSNVLPPFSVSSYAILIRKVPIFGGNVPAELTRW